MPSPKILEDLGIRYDEKVVNCILSYKICALHSNGHPIKQPVLTHFISKYLPQ